MEENNIIQEKINKVNGDIQLIEYQKGKLLGKGGFAKCFEFTNLETKKVLAAKIIPKVSLVKSRSRQKLISEIKIHKSLHNTNIVQFDHVFEDQENVYILLELCPNQTLNELTKRRKRLTEIEVQCYTVQIISSLKYLHQNRVIHRDLKLGNLFLSGQLEIKLGDFGLATRLEFNEEKKRTICGTPNYIAPEILDDKMGHSYPVDIWSLGVIIYTLLIGKPPFETSDVKATYKKIKANNYAFPEHIQISESSRSLIESILKLDPSERPSLNQIMEHPFLSSNPIPKNLPISTLACLPSQNYIKQFQQTQFNKQINQNPVMMTGNFFASGTQSQKNLGTYNNLGEGNQGNFQDLDKLNLKTMTNTNFHINSINTQNNNYGLVQTDRQGIENEQDLVDYQSISSVCVAQWVDYTSKYGLGYILNNGNCGVFFNDSTKIISHSIEDVIQYKDKKSNDKQDESYTYTSNTIPDNLKKKFTLLQHFKSYLQNNNNQLQNYKFLDPTQDMVYVKKWMKTTHAIMFRLSNKIVQVNFTDKTEIHLSSEQKAVVYKNKKGEIQNYPLVSALESTNIEMSKRLKYTKEILTHIYYRNKDQKEQPQVNIDLN